MATFMAAHYKSKLRQGRVRTSAATVTNQWITRPTLFPPDFFRLFASARLGLLPVNAHRQPQTDANAHRQCPHCHVHETAQLTYSACGRDHNQRRLRHGHAITAVLPHLKPAVTRLLSRATWVRDERSLATLAPPGNDTNSDPDGDSGATSAVDNDPWLLRNPCASVVHIAPGARDPHTWTLDPLVVVAVGVWGTITHSAIAALTPLGLSVAAANAALGAALEYIAQVNMLISRLRYSSPTRWRGA